MQLHAGLDFRNRNTMGGEDVEHDGREETCTAETGNDRGLQTQAEFSI